MTVKELEHKFNSIGIKLKRKIKISDEYEITYDDFKNGKIYQKYISSDNIQRMVDGFMTLDSNIVYCQVSVTDINIESDDIFPPCGGELLVNTYANYEIDNISLDGNIVTTITGKSKINALISVDNDLFSYEKPYLINYNQNDGDSDIIVDIDASYYHAGSKYKASKRISQPISSISQWKVKEEPTNKIMLSLDKYKISGKGGKITAKVEKEFSRIYYKEDGCGNIVGEKCEPNLVEDITNDCIITTSDKKAFEACGNVINVHKQEADSDKRECTVTARYLDKSDTTIIYQSAGGKTTYKYDLSFIDDMTINTLYLDTCMASVNIVELNSRKFKYIDNSFVSSSIVSDLIIENEADWLKISVDEENNMCLLTVNAIQANEDKNSDREEVITIWQREHPDTPIHLIVSQPHMTVKETKYVCEFISNGTYDVDDVNNEKLHFSKPYKQIIYENGDIEYLPINKSLTFKYTFETSDRHLYGSIMKDVDNYYMLFNHPDIKKDSNIVVTAHLTFYDENGDFMFNSNDANIVLISKNKVLLTVYAYTNEKPNKDIWSTPGELIVDFKHEINLKPCWISPDMEEYKDIIYKGFININEGRHVFEINGLYIDGKEYYITGEIIVDEEMKETEIGIEI